MNIQADTHGYANHIFGTMNMKRMCVCSSNRCFRMLALSSLLLFLASNDILSRVATRYHLHSSHVHLHKETRSSWICGTCHTTKHRDTCKEINYWYFFLRIIKYLNKRGAGNLPFCYSCGVSSISVYLGF